MEWCRDAIGLTYGGALLLCAALCALSATWVHVLDRTTQPGLARLLAALPAVGVFLLTPKLFCRWQDTTTIVLASFNWAWLSNFKAAAVLLAPLTPQQSGPSRTEVAAAKKAGSDARQPNAVGIRSSSSSSQQQGEGAQEPPPPPLQQQRRARGRFQEDAGGPTAMLSNWLSKLALLGVLVVVLQHPLPTLVRAFFMALGLYSLLSLIMDGPAALAVGAIGLRVSPHFDRPWAATSVTSFWNKRWDLAAGNALRQLVYEPVVERRLLYDPSAAAQAAEAAPPLLRLAGGAATFLASGLCHEVIFWYLTGHTSSGIWLSFFMLQPPIMAVERVLLAALKRRGLLLPSLLLCVCTVLLVTATSILFWYPVDAWGVTDSIVSNIQQVGKQAAAAWW